MILVTGGTGLLGSHLLYKLVSNNEKVKAIYRTERKLDIVKKVFSYYTEDVDIAFNSIEWVKADLNNTPLLTEAFKGVDYVYHCAAFVSFEPNKYHLLRRTNIEGTANIVNFCISNNVKKLCYVSSVAALGEAINSQPITEKTDWNPEGDHSVYAITKYGAEMEVWRGSQEGLDVIIVNPGVILGAGIWRYGSGNLFKKVYKGLKYYPKGVAGFIDIDDVVSIMIKLIKSDIKNESFILVSENLCYKEFLSAIAEHLQVNTPKKEAKSWLLQFAWRLDFINHKLTRKRRGLTKHLARTLVSNTHYDNTKVKNALTFKFKTISQSISEVSQLFLKEH